MSAIESKLRREMSPGIVLVLVSIVGIIVPLTTTVLDFVQRNELAEEQAVRDTIVADRVEQTRKELVHNNTNVDARLEEIHQLVNAQLTLALNNFREATDTIEAMRVVMLRIAPNDARVKEVLLEYARDKEERGKGADP